MAKNIQNYPDRNQSNHFRLGTPKTSQKPLIPVSVLRESCSQTILSLRQVKVGFGKQPNYG